MSLKCKMFGHKLVPVNSQIKKAKCKRCGELFIYKYNVMTNTLSISEIFNPYKDYNKNRRRIGW